MCEFSKVIVDIWEADLSCRSNLLDLLDVVRGGCVAAHRVQLHEHLGKFNDPAGFGAASDFRYLQDQE